MQTEEVEVAIEELETRLERLRSLYEQYFLGIEKIEPSIARKDVDRRIWLLRREQIRNTARRFKLQTIIQRYNTFQQYWQRICREIENGTYKRHLLRAEKNFGPEKALTIAARKRFRHLDREAQAAAAGKADEAQKRLEADLGAALDDATYDPLEEAKRAVDAALGRVPTAPPEGGSATGGKPSSPAPGPPRTPSPARARPRELGRLELDLEDDLLGGGDSAPLRPAAAVAARAPGRAPKASPIGPRPAASTPAGPRSAAPAPAARPPQPARPLPQPARALPQPARPPPRPAPPARPATPGRPPPPIRAAAGQPTGGAPRQAGMSEDRVKELHARLVDARKQTNDRRNISVDGLKKSLQAAESKLRAQHGNRRIDFDVVIKDGKAVVKPIVR